MNCFDTTLCEDLFLKAFSSSEDSRRTEKGFYSYPSIEILFLLYVFKLKLTIPYQEILL